MEEPHEKLDADAEFKHISLAHGNIHKSIMEKPYEKLDANKEFERISYAHVEIHDSTFALELLKLSDGLRTLAVSRAGIAFDGTYGSGLLTHSAKVRQAEADLAEFIKSSAAKLQELYDRYRETDTA